MLYLDSISYIALTETFSLTKMRQINTTNKPYAGYIAKTTVLILEDYIEFNDVSVTQDEK